MKHICIFEGPRLCESGRLVLVQFIERLCQMHLPVSGHFSKPTMGIRVGGTTTSMWTMSPEQNLEVQDNRNTYFRYTCYTSTKLGAGLITHVFVAHSTSLARNPEVQRITDTYPKLEKQYIKGAKWRRYLRARRKKCHETTSQSYIVQQDIVTNVVLTTCCI